MCSKEDFKKWVENKSGITIWHYSLKPKNELAKLANYGILHKAKDAINREGKLRILTNEYCTKVGELAKNGFWYYTISKYQDCNNSEQEALQKSLEYIEEQEKK